ncbi:hypothetical protein EYR40_008317 [Pleurotus pulmonarius]|nr:hypothetical protein EYR40_008317 [Pleurotus pulmonarius]
MILRQNSVKVTRDNAAAAPTLAQEASQDAHLQRAPEPPAAKGLEVHVEQTHGRTASSWGRDIHAEHVPLAPARQIHAEDAVERDLTPSLTSLPPNPPFPLAPLPLTPEATFGSPENWLPRVS